MSKSNNVPTLPSVFRKKTKRDVNSQHILCFTYFTYVSLVSSILTVLKRVNFPSSEEVFYLSIRVEDLTLKCSP